MLHRIRKQVMDLTIDGRLDAFRTQHLAAPFYYRQLLPVLEKIFDELSSEEVVIQLDKLELDLGIIAVKELESVERNKELEILLRKQVTMALQEQRREMNLRRSPGKVNSCRQWLFYLKHGYLSWHNKGFDEKAQNDILEMLATNYSLVQELRELIRRDTNAKRRIVSGHDVKFLANLVEVLTATAQRALAQAVDELVIWSKLVQKERSGSRQQIWLRIIELASAADSAMKTEDIVKMVMLGEKYHQPIVEDIQSKLTTLPIINPVWKELQQKHLTPASVETYNAIKKKEDEKLVELTADKSDEVSEEGIFVAHAGLILLHPFLPAFFKNLGLTADKNFRNDEAAEKALRLLHYLATGNSDEREYELVIPKIVCGLPIHQAPASTIELSQEEKQEADELLSIVIENWEKLGSSSIAALRENFLQREGKLYMKNDIRCLQVETGSLDVLLDYLPWSLSIIKLPWMKEMLRVEWR